MPVRLTQDQIDRALPALRVGLDRYLRIQAAFAALRAVSTNAEFRRRFNGYYKVIRRNAGWYDEFYSLFDRARETNAVFSDVLDELKRRTGKFEASFASKMVATYEPTKPVIDEWVLKNVERRLPYQGHRERSRAIKEVYQGLCDDFDQYLASTAGRSLVQQFRQMYPNAEITETKMLDLVLWQTR